MTFHTREAMDEIYGIFNQPLKTEGDLAGGSDSGDDSEDEDDDDYTSAGESTGTGRISGTTSEFGDQTGADFTMKTTADEEPDETEVKSVSEWSEFTASKHIPKDDQPDGSDEETENTQDEPLEVHQDPQEDVHEGDHELATPTSPEPGSVRR